MQVGRSRHHIKEKLYLIAGNQHGYFTAGQAIQAGYVNNHHPYHVSQNHWLKIATGLYRLPGFPDSMEANFTKWSLWSRNQQDQPQGIISHHSALAYFELGEYRPLEIHLSVPNRFRKTVPAGVIIHKASVVLSDLEAQPTFMVTRLPKTLADLQAFLAELNLWEDTVKKAFTRGKLSREEYLHLGFAPKAISPDARLDSGTTFSPGAETAAPEKANLFAASVCPSNEMAEGKCVSRPGGTAFMRENIYKMIFQRTRAATQSPKRRAQAGFTLVELLVVITIISLLAGMLLPVLEKAIASARGISCKNNLRQQNLAMQLYAGDYGNYVPAAAMGAGAPGVSTNWYDTRWVMQLPRYLDGVLATNQTWYKTAECQKCPAFYTHYPNADKKVSAANSYTIARWFNTNKMTLPWPSLNSARLPHPANTPTYLDGVQAPVHTYMSLWQIVSSGATTGMDCIGTYHNGGANFLFFDAHVKSVPFAEFFSWNWGSYDAP